MQPLVSILINNFNYGRFVADAIESALKQSYPHREIIVVDDGSTDNSREIISAYGTRIKAIFKNNGGQASAFNTGFANSRGEIICLLDSDDVFLPQKVQEVVSALRNHKRKWHFHRLRWTDTALTPIPMPGIDHDSGDYDFRSECINGTLRFAPPSTSGLSFTRQTLEQVLPMPESSGVTISDNYLKYAILALAPGYFSTRQWALQRIHDANAYTLKHNPSVKAEILLATAANLRARFPVLRSLCNQMYAEGLRLRFCTGGSLSELYREARHYLNASTFSERAVLIGRVARRVSRDRMSQNSTRRQDEHQASYSL